MPIIPLHLFKLRNFSISCAVNFFAGFILFVCSYYLPIWFQNVQGETATQSGLQSIATSIGLIVTSITVGNIVSKTGHYFVFPIIGHAVEILGTLRLVEQY
jgi:MFS family permease